MGDVKNVDVYALVGPSGTGKSHHAMEVAEKLNVNYIIDDGLLIYNGKRLAGQSAKAEPSMVAAVKRAIFFDPFHAESVRYILTKDKPKCLLILGTSEHMIDRIIAALQLPPLKEILFIQNIVTQEDIEMAQEMRRAGRHVIPLPAIEVRKDLPNVWIDPIVGLFKRKKKKNEKEKTIIRPVFSNYGKVTVSEQVVIQLVRHLAQGESWLDDMLKIGVQLTDLGVLMKCDVKIHFGIPVQREIMGFQKKVSDEVEMLTGLAVRSVDVHVQGITIA